VDKYNNDDLFPKAKDDDFLQKVQQRAGNSENLGSESSGAENITHQEGGVSARENFDNVGAENASASGLGQADYSSTHSTIAGGGRTTAMQNQARAVAKFLPTNLPPASANQSSGDLNSEEIAYLNKITDQNYYITKRIKKVKGGVLVDDVHYLNRVRRLYSLNFSRRYFGFPPIQVKKLRDRTGEDRSKIFGAAARRAKKMVLLMVIIVALIATVGTGAVVAVMAVNSMRNTVYKENFIIVNAKEISERPINDYILGQSIDYPVKLRNYTGAPATNIQFHIELRAVSGEEDDANGTYKNKFKTALGAGTIKPQELSITYNFSNTNTDWKIMDNTITHDSSVIRGPTLIYVGTKNADKTPGILGSYDNTEDYIEVISGFTIDIKDYNEANKWANFCMQLVFVVNAENANDTSQS